MDSNLQQLAEGINSNLPVKLSGTLHVSMMHYVNKRKLYTSKDTDQTIIKTYLKPIFARLNGNTHDNTPAMICMEEYHQK